MPDPRRTRISVGNLSIQPAEAIERWEVRGPGEQSQAVEATWGEWVRLAKRILDTDALSRTVEERGDAWDLGFAAGRSADEAADTPNPFR